MDTADWCSSSPTWSSETVREVVVLRRGSHFHPVRGACLVELAGLLSGSRWTDHPDGVDATLAALARAVNDRTSDSGRSRLLPLAPWLVITPTSGATASRTAVAAVAARAALPHATAPQAVRLTRDAAAVALPSPSRSWWSRWCSRRLALRLIHRAVAVVSRLPHADDELYRMLLAAVDAARTLDDLPPLQADVLQPVAVDQLPVRVRAHAPEGIENQHYHTAALLDQWPESLVRAWAARQVEISECPPTVVAAHLKRPLRPWIIDHTNGRSGQDRTPGPCGCLPAGTSVGIDAADR